MAFATLPLGVRKLMAEVFATLPFQICIDCWGIEQIYLGNTINGSFPQLTLQIHHPGVIRSLLLRQDSLILADAYLNGLVDFAGEIEDLIVLTEHLFYAQKQPPNAMRAWMESLTLPRLPSLLPKLSPWQQLKLRSRDRDRVAVRHHYDVGNEFYQLWLDPLLVYSCAHFEHPEMSLQQAQEAKLDLICRKLQLKPGDYLLDIGCGWGALLRWAITHYNVQGYGITLSEEQLAFNQKYIDREGLGDSLRVEMLDYRDLPKEPTFDKIVSVGMVEHVGIKNYPVYFQSALSALKPGGLFLNHGVTNNDRSKSSTIDEKFIDRYIFPDGQLADLSTTLSAIENAGWEIVDVETWRIHYAKTLRHWLANLDKVIDPAASLISERRLQLWRIYLLGCALSFERNKIGIYQTLLRRQADWEWNLPLTRTGWLC